MDELFPVASADGAEEGGGTGGAGVGGEGKEEKQLRLYLEAQMQGDREADVRYIDALHSLAFHPDLFLPTKHTLLPPPSDPTLTSHIARIRRALLVPPHLRHPLTRVLLRLPRHRPLLTARDLTRILHEAGVECEVPGGGV